MPTEDVAVHLERIDGNLDNLNRNVAELTRLVREQNGRVNKLETESLVQKAVLADRGDWMQRQALNTRWIIGTVVAAASTVAAIVIAAARAV